MKKILSILFATTLISSAAIAQSDSVGVFHRPEKVIILINEGNQGTSRLADMMDFLKVGDNFQVFSPDQTIKISCARGNGAATCTFRFFPGQDVIISPKKLEAATALSDLSLKMEGSFELYFESSMEDKFLLSIVDGHIHFSASKR